MLRDAVPQPQTLTVRRNIQPLAIVEIDGGIRPPCYSRSEQESNSAQQGASDSKSDSETRPVRERGHDKTDNRTHQELHRNEKHG
jgi:hypothetical protein